MSTIQLVAILVSLAAAFAYVNARWIRLPSQIGLMAMSLVGSLVVVGLDAAGVIDAARIQHVVAAVDFGPTLLHGMLGLLLFAGALHIGLEELRDQKWQVLALALGSTVLSTAMVGGAIYTLLRALGHDIGLIDALLFGALISPTDPIAVLGAMKSSNVPRTLSIQISGESLFNDGIGVVIFVTISAVAGGGEVTAGSVAALFLREAIGGAVFGLVIGLVGRRLLSTVPDSSVAVLITLALVVGGYAAAEAIHVSAPIAVIIAGIAIGGPSREHVDMFWELVDEILNAILFLMLGLEATRLRVTSELAIAAVLAVPIVLGARLSSVWVGVAAVRPFRSFPQHAVKVLTWSGLRGGLAVALALSLPAGSQRDTILVMTYAVVTFSILVQGLTLPRLLRRLGLG